MKGQFVFSFTLLLVGFWMSVFVKFHMYFTDPKIYLNEINHLKHEVEMSKFRQELMRDQVIEFQMEVAKLLPNYLKTKPADEANYPLRNLASLITTEPNDKFLNSKMRIAFSKAKASFREKDFKKASKELLEFIDKYPFSIDIAEAFFLLSESYFQIEDFERSLTAIEKMIELFPESELTAFAMLRMGKIFEYQDRPEEAVDIYQTVLKVFPERGVASQAKKSLRSVEL